MKIKKTEPQKPPRMVLYGEHKIGKSSFAANSIKPLFIQTEDGLDNLSVDAFDKAKSFEEVKEQLRDVAREDHTFKTLVIDSLDWLERLIWKKICAENNVAQIGDVPYGGGYKLALNLWQEFINALDYINETKQMMIILLAHSKITKFEDPTRQNYDRFSLDLQDKASGLILQWCDIIAFANEQVIVTEKKEGFGTTIKAKDTGIRMLNVNKKAAYEAGNRYGLEDCKLNFSEFWNQIKDKVKVKKNETLVKGDV